MAQAYKSEYSPEDVLEKLFQRGLLNTDGTSPYIQKIIDNNLEIQSNQFFWQEHFTIDGAEVTGNVVITEPTEVRAEAEAGYFLPAGTNKAWYYQV